MPRISKKEKTDDFINNEKTQVVSSKNDKVKKKSTSGKSSTTTKKVAQKKTTNSKTKSTKNVSPILEYYDLPYRYNKTTVKILAQTPTILFVYWDISDIDRQNFIDKYGNDFFNKTKPILLIHNKTKNYYFEVEINDFANSWYLRTQEPNCEYDIELRRRDIENPNKNIYISCSNQLILPNNHVLFDETDFTNIKFKNVNTGTISQKDFGSIRLITNIGTIYNKKHKVYNFYNDLYKDEVLENNKNFSNPSSNSSFKTF